MENAIEIALRLAPDDPGLIRIQLSSNPDLPFNVHLCPYCSCTQKLLKLFSVDALQASDYD